MKQTNLPYELFYMDYDEDTEIDVWYYPVLDCIRIYVNKKLWETIWLNKPQYYEHKTLGRVQV